jgi:hypothetical protein
MDKNILFIWPLPGQKTIEKGFTYKMINDQPATTPIHIDGITEDLINRNLMRAAYIISEDGEVEFIREFDDPEFDDMFEKWEEEVSPGLSDNIDEIMEDLDEGKCS